MGGQGRKPIIPLFSPKRYRERCGLPKPLPLGEVALRSNDGEGKPGRKEPLRSDGQALCQSDAIAVPVILGQQPCPLSLVALLLASSPKGGAIGMSASFRLDERSAISRKQQCSAVWASDSLTRSVVQKPLPPQARPALLRPVEPQSSSGK
jgi:hypothetical protein